MRPVLTLLLASLALATPAFGQDREIIGTGRLFTNDFLGDGHDRWRSASYVLSIVHGRDAYSGDEALGEIIEYRLGSQIISGARTNTGRADRPYVGAISMGVHTHFDFAGTAVSIGADVMAIGPQTKLSAFQERFHESFSIPLPPDIDQQLDDIYFFNSTFEARRAYAISDRVTVQPFVEGLAGVENLIRVGGDMVVGQVGQNNLMLRDVVTGQLYRGTQAATSGLTYTFGGDVAAVFDSAFLPENRGYAVSEIRARARAGVLVPFSKDATVFYGATYLSEEFEGQREGQVVGSLNLNFDF